MIHSNSKYIIKYTKLKINAHYLEEYIKAHKLSKQFYFNKYTSTPPSKNWEFGMVIFSLLVSLLLMAASRELPSQLSKGNGQPCCILVFPTHLPCTKIFPCFEGSLIIIIGVLHISQKFILVSKNTIECLEFFNYNAPMKIGNTFTF